MSIAAHGQAPTAELDLASWLPVLVIAGIGSGYLALALRARRRQRWPGRRALAFVAGIVILAAALSPPFEHVAERDFAGHAAQHLLVAMVAPLALVLGAPVTLLLRTLPRRHARRLGAGLNTAPMHALTHPMTALTLSSGGLLVLYLTPLYRLSSDHEALHLLVHLHLVLAGFLFAWVVAGIDPAPRRAAVRVRLVVLGVSVAVHASVAQLIYAGILVDVREPIAEMQAAGSLMYFGGDLAELLLAIVLLATARSGHRPREPHGAAADHSRLRAVAAGARGTSATSPAATPATDPAVGLARPSNCGATR